MGFIKGHKVSEETKNKISLALKGWSHSTGMLGKHQPDVAKKKISIANKGNKHTLGKHWKIKDSSSMNLDKIGRKRPPFSEDWKRKISNALRGRKSSLETRIKQSQALPKKENHWNWQGGVTLLSNMIRKCFEYRQWRSDIFTRDDFTCQKCIIRGGKIVADHIKAFSIILYENKIKTMEEALNCEELWNINNGRTLCQKCHEKTENYGLKAVKTIFKL